MAAVFEIVILSKSIIPMNLLLNILEQRGFRYEMDSAESIDSWEYDNHVDLDVDTENDILTEMVIGGKIIMLSGLLNSRHRSGCTVHMLDNTLFSTNIWISTKEIQNLDRDAVTKSNGGIYNMITEEIIRLGDHQIVLSGIGTEVYIDFNQATDLIFDRASNINRWIIPNTDPIKNISGFRKGFRDGFVILSREG